MSANGNVQEIRTAGQLRAMLGRLLIGVESGKVTPEQASSACKIAQTINQSLAEETKAILAAKEIGALQIGFGHTIIDDSAPKMLESQ